MNRKSRNLLATLLFAILACALGACTQNLKPAQAWTSSSQLVLVIVPDWSAEHGTLRTYTRINGAWQVQSDAQPVVVGRTGSAWGQGLNRVPHDGPVKREGDGRATAGVFRIGEAFGYADRAVTALDYHAMHVDDYCIDVPSSPLYNQIVDTRNADPSIVAGSTEPMRRDLHANGDQRYRLGFVIEHNAGNTPDAGSCIFAHIWASPDTPTAGCTAMDGAAMEHLLAWLDPKQQPIFVLLPQAQYKNLQKDWDLPAQ